MLLNNVNTLCILLLLDENKDLKKSQNNSQFSGKQCSIINNDSNLPITFIKKLIRTAKLIGAE